MPFWKLHFTTATLIVFVIVVSTFPLVAQCSQNVTPTMVIVRADGTIEVNSAAVGSLSDSEQKMAKLVLILCRQQIKGGKVKPENEFSSCNRRPVILKADESLNYGSFVNFILAVRSTGADPIKIEASHDQTDPFAFVPHEPDPNQDLSTLKPNPMTLVVRVSSDGQLHLNQESQGTIADTSQLKNRLLDRFEYRTKYRDVGTNEIEKTVFVDAACSLRFGDIMKIVDVVKQAGAAPTKLKIDEVGIEFETP